MTNSKKMPPCTPTTTTLSTIRLVQDDITDGFHFEGIEDTAQLIVSDLHCKMLMKQTITDREFVSISSLRKGIYIARLTTGGRIIAKKIVKS